MLEREIHPSSEEWLDDLFALMDQAGGCSQGERWTREDIYSERLDRFS
jgi:hypothetical protein